MSMIKDLVYLAVFCFGVMCGWVANKVEFDHAGCDDYSGKHHRYEAWLSVRDGTYRCFWIEKDYPHRVRMQGVIDVK
jgi:hypothetical protein